VKIPIGRLSLDMDMLLIASGLIGMRKLLPAHKDRQPDTGIQNGIIMEMT
jgi:hypothetical protein